MNTPTPLPEERLPLTRRVRVRTAQGERLAEPQSVDQFADVHAWVLLGDPGAGKSDVFFERSQAEGGTSITARDFVEIGPDEGWHEPLFIDALDEISSGTALGFTALGRIRSKLQALGTPRFRISCREADWRGSADSEALKKLVAPDEFLELHLEALDDADAQALVAFWQGSNTTQAKAFLQEAQRRGLEGLLDNPRNLLMLVEATKTGWPDSKAQTYQLACAQLVRERNPAWLAQTAETALPDDELLLVAGSLCALMLLSGGTALALQPPTRPTPGVLALNELPTVAGAPSPEACRAALHRRLFKRQSAGVFTGAHRTVAEHLAAHYLAQRIHAGLPLPRVLALMLGEDGGVVPDLRGLHAWLAAVTHGTVREALIDHDPLGIVLYGDVQAYTRSEKLRVLQGLSREAQRYAHFRSQDWTSHPFGALATPDMENVFRRLLISPDRSLHHLALVDCILDALAHGHDMPALKPELEQVIRDASYWSGSRTEALRVLLAQEAAEGRWFVSLQLLHDIHARKIEDTEDQLLGTLLSALYPAHIPATEIWTYFRKPKSDSLLGAYWEFWQYLAEKYAPGQDIPVLLDALHASGFQLGNQHDSRDAAKVVGELLVRGVRRFGAELEPARLYRWLSLGLGPHHRCPLDLEHKNALRDWLEIHPDRYKVLFEHGLRLQSDNEDPWGAIWQVLQRLYHAPEPCDADQWYLSLTDKTPQDQLRRHLLSRAFHFVETMRGIDSALVLLEMWRAAHSLDATWVDEYLRCAYPPSTQDQEHIEWELKHKREIQKEEREKIEFFRKALPSFDTQAPHLGALVPIANAYLNFFHDGNEKTPQERLLALLNQNPDWVELAFHGLRQCLFRPDLPSAQAIIELDAQGQRYNIATPCLAAMMLRHAENPATALELPPAALETVVAFRLTNDYGDPPEWFQQMLATRADLVAKILSPLLRARLATKKDHIAGLYALAHNPDYAAVAKLIVPELLQAFPAKSHKKQLESLRLLIIAALTQLDPTVALETVARKLAGSPLDVAQHVYWLVAGLQLAPEVYLEPARRYISQTQARTSHLVSLLLDQREERRLRITWPVAVLEFLITLLGPRSNPRQWRNGAGWVTPAMHLGEYVEGLIATLAGMPDEESTQALATLLQAPQLAQWSDTLRRAAFDQQITRRKARFKPATAAQVCATLANRAPANAADLWALTLDHLVQLVREIRNGNTNDYRQYWDRAAAKPKGEEDCRDTLLSDLKPRLAPLSVSAEPEGRYADEKRADIKILASDCNIPVEIKRDAHPDLWKAIPDQLIAKYTRDPACDGFGIYLVFWFGGAKQAAPRDGGVKPKTAQELQARLQASVPEPQRHKIAVLVLDCSLPPPVKS